MVTYIIQSLPDHPRRLKHFFIFLFDRVETSHTLFTRFSFNFIYGHIFFVIPRHLSLNMLQTPLSVCYMKHTHIYAFPRIVSNQFCIVCKFYTIQIQLDTFSNSVSQYAFVWIHIQCKILGHIHIMSCGSKLSSNMPYLFDTNNPYHLPLCDIFQHKITIRQRYTIYKYI